MKKFSLCLVIAVLCVTSIACAQSYTGKVITVTDSSNISVVYNNTVANVRLNCVQSPAMGQPFAQEAVKYLQDLILNKTVEVRTVWQDHDGRQVARILLDGTSVAVTLAGAGLAMYDSRQQQDGQVAIAQAEAQGKKIGIWSDPNPVPPWTFQTNQRGIIPNTSGPPTNVGSSGYGAPAASTGGDAGTSWDTGTQILSTAPYYGGYYGGSAWGGVGPGAAAYAASNRGAVSRGGGGRR